MLIAVFTCCLAVWGCDSEKKKDGEKDNKTKTAKKTSGGHDHKHGPNGDVLFSLAELDLHAELLIDKSTNNVRICFCDAEGEKPVAVKLDKVRIYLDDESHELQPFEPADGASTTYSHKDKDLGILARNRPNLEITMGDKKQSIRLPRPH
jgi:hypothetical protein